MIVYEVRNVLNGTALTTYASMKEAAQAVNGHKDRTGDCCRGIRESHAGYFWRYAEEQKEAR
jgi:hypothetical protein